MNLCFSSKHISLREETEGQVFNLCRPPTKAFFSQNKTFWPGTFYSQLKAANMKMLGVEWCSHAGLHWRECFLRTHEIKLN